jgi:hypothetical protein
MRVVISDSKFACQRKSGKSNSLKLLLKIKKRPGQSVASVLSACWVEINGNRRNGKDLGLHIRGGRGIRF